jgi:drug/metabolite transporter (DMT)-like permease
VLSILFGLTSALVWGAGDFFGGLASRRINAALAAFYSEAAGVLPLLLIALISREPMISGREILLCSIAGAVGSLGLVGLYKSFSSGQLAISAPTSGIMAAALPVIVGAVFNGLPAFATLCGFALSMLAIFLITQPGGSQSGPSTRLRLSALRLPALAGMGFGCYFILIHLGASTGVFWPMVASRVSGAVTLFLFVRGTHEPWSLPRNVIGLALLTALFDVGGNTFYILAAQAGRMDVAAVLGSLYSGCTALMGWVFLKEKINRTQFAGILAALGAVALLTL